MNKKREETQQIKGASASSGKARGKVKKVNSSGVNQEFKTGMVLVAETTTPEMTPLMKKAIAIVTDRGGITSHAAIISREFGIPCIVGTRIVSRVLKDGDFVEVNADEGVVRKLRIKTS